MDTRNIIWLVVYLPLWKIWKSVGIIIISQSGLWNSQYMENTFHVPNHQPVIYVFGMPNRNIGWCWYNMMYPVYHDGLLLITLIYWKSMVDDGYNENLANSIVSSIVLFIWMLMFVLIKQLMIGGPACEKVTASTLVLEYRESQEIDTVTRNGEEIGYNRLGRIILRSVN